jgi:hypothetical protein
MGFAIESIQCELKLNYIWYGKNRSIHYWNLLLSMRLYHTDFGLITSIYDVLVLNSFFVETLLEN